MKDGKWVSGPLKIDDDGVVPPYLFRKEIFVEKRIISAKMYASALGCFVIKINGAEVSGEYFAPGYSQYNRRLLYKTYDVSNLFRHGKNTIEAEVSGGWYAGRLGLMLKRNCFGDKRALRIQVQLRYSEGTTEKIETDESWLYSTDGPRRFADFFDGEVYDARMESAEQKWAPVKVFGNLQEAVCANGRNKREKPKLEAFDGVPVLRHEEIVPVSVRLTDESTLLVDFGRNFAGVMALHNFCAPAGAEIHIRHGEVLTGGGKLYTNNLRTAKAELHYICKNGTQTYIPRFTYMGFRYAEVSIGGNISQEEKRVLVSALKDDCITAYELYSDMAKNGSFSCSDPRLNQLQQNIETSLKANFLDIPTDCPQRDERCGWTGDISVFIPTACFNYDLAVFMRKWLRDLAMAQRPNGSVPHIIPDNGLYNGAGNDPATHIMNWSTAVWGDAAIMVPWQMYWETGDLSFLADQYDSMKAWLNRERRAAARLSFGRNRYIWDKSYQYGDWLAPGESLVDNILKGKWTATAYFANSAAIMEKTARLLGKQEDAHTYAALHENIRNAFRKTFLDKDGHIKKGFQSIYVLAVWFDLLNEKERKIALEDLVEDIKKRNYHLATGFVGTPYLCFVLSDHGYIDAAYKILMQDTPPGWLYPIKCGATSIWERWDALKEDGTVKDGKDADINMVSFNHYAYGAIGNWLYQRVAGLEPIEPGYRHFCIKPIPGGGLTWAQITHCCRYGTIAASWRIENDSFTLCATVPEDTICEITLPNGMSHQVSGGRYTYSIPYSNERRQ